MRELLKISRPPIFWYYKYLGTIYKVVEKDDIEWKYYTFNSGIMSLLSKCPAARWKYFLATNASVKELSHEEAVKLVPEFGRARTS